MKKLEFVSNRLAEAGLKVKLSVCKFLISRLKFLNHLVDEDDIHT